MIYSHHRYTPRWRRQMRITNTQSAIYMKGAAPKRTEMPEVSTAEDLLAADLDNEALSEAFSALSLEEQMRYLDLREMACPWAITGLEH